MNDYVLKIEQLIKLSSAFLRSVEDVIRTYSKNAIAFPSEEEKTHLQVFIYIKKLTLVKAFTSTNVVSKESSIHCIKNKKIRVSICNLSTAQLASELVFGR
ncbi:hypothetical protein SOMG_02840 [Schizosaccharomyces osmophilus]|uniref:Uncharacterized protein n=1 Tax=Schizosaccharomyces osmophilus TaxID=2545709 RepID=A0AAE9WEV0_9SCHI|nr:uncharacterized protein SOMG_02840 [Schizosaccharomyces osmophilus]WBW73917.1 hypothetical protein SOMG_02840 [Schizosaccharomyces osmophilus]